MCSQYDDWRLTGADMLREAGLSPGEAANPGWSYRLPQDGTLLAGPCDTPGCRYVSKPGGYRHDGPCSDAPESAPMS